MADLQVTLASGDSALLRERDVRQLAKGLRGELLLPISSGYNEARRVWNGAIDRRPAIIARCADEADVSMAVRFAREHELLASVRGGGHNIAGKALVEGGIVIDLSAMRQVRVDPDACVVRIEGGATLGDLDRETQAHGLATTAGVVTHTGMAGLALGGGIGHIGRKFGLACDNLLLVRLIDAGGNPVEVSKTDHPELFWGLQGGGGNFGIATSLDFRLHPVGPMVLGGAVLHTLSRACEALRFYREFSLSAPDELAMNAILMRSPGGEPTLAITACYFGEASGGERLLEPLRRFGPPAADQLSPVAYRTLQAGADAFFPTGFRFYWKTHFLSQISDDAIGIVVDHFAEAPSSRSIIAFQQYGGAVSRVAPSATAFSHREAQYDFIPVSVWTEAADSERQIEWVRSIWSRMKPYATGGEYVNNLGDEEEERVRAAYGSSYDRLVALKTKYDPDNFFRLNANIEPSRSSPPH